MPSAVQLIRASGLSDVAEYAYAATASKDARLIFLAGTCPLNADGDTVAAGDFAGQAAACVETMKQALAAAGASIEDVISTRVLVASSAQADLVAAWEVVRDAFPRRELFLAIKRADIRDLAAMTSDQIFALHALRY